MVLNPKLIVQRDEPQAPEASADEIRVIKRYSNRKLYDTVRSKYVTLDEIAQMIKAGDEVAIVDNESKEDLTSVTLAQIIFEEEKRESRMPLSMLRNLIQTGGATLQDFLDRSVVAPVTEMRDHAQKNVEDRVEELRKSAVHLRDAALRKFSREERRAEEFRKATTASLDELSERIRQRILEVSPMNEDSTEEAHASRTELTHDQTREFANRLRTRLKEIHSQLDDLEAKTRR